MRRFALAAGLFTLASASRAHAAEPDPWLGPDKALHFAATFELSAGGYLITSEFTSDVRTRLWAGAAVGMGVGIAKELYDLTGAGDPSWRDLTWDAIGTATGLLVSWAIDQLFFQPHSSSKPAALRWSVRVGP